jgi:hypothetical protein
VTYIDPGVVDDETQVAEAILAAIADQIPGWEPSEGSPETAMGEAMGVIAATVAALIKDEERSNFAGFGQRILQLERQAAGVASAVSEWTLTANPDGFTIPAGSELVLDSPVSGEPVAFATLGDRFVPATVLVASGVTVSALEPGEQANGCVGDAAEFDDLTSGEASIANVTLTTPASGGSEEEPLEDYTARVADRARRVRAIPVTAEDFAAFALDIPEVDRALAVNLLDPDNPPAPEEDPASLGHVTVFPLTATGEALVGPPRAALAASYTTTDRPLAVQVHIADPTVTDLDVTITFRLAPGADEDDTLAGVSAALTAYLDPATWMLDETVGGRWRRPNPIDRPVREYDIATVAALVDGVAGVTAVTINGVEEVDLPGWAPLPNLTNLTMTIAT